MQGLEHGGETVRVVEQQARAGEQCSRENSQQEFVVVLFDPVHGKEGDF